MWMRCSIGQQWVGGRCAGAPQGQSWPQAQQQAEEVNRAGSQFFSDWRLPLLRELATLAERQCKNPRINLAVFPDTPAATYWSATPAPGRTTNRAALALDFGDAGVRVLDKQDSVHLRLVRSAR